MLSLRCAVLSGREGCAERRPRDHRGRGSESAAFSLVSLDPGCLVPKTDLGLVAVDADRTTRQEPMDARDKMDNSPREGQICLPPPGPP